MNDGKLTKELKRVFTDIFNIAEDEIEDESSPDTIEN